MKLPFVFSIIFFCLFGCAPDSPQKKQLPQTQKNKEVVPQKKTLIWATWVKASRQKYNAQSWKKKCIRYRNIGITDVLVQATPETLQKMLPVAHQQELKVHAWIKTLNRHNDPVARKHPDWYAVNREGKSSRYKRPYVRYYEWLSPFHPDARNYIKSIIRQYTSIKGLSSIHLDYIRYPDVYLGKSLQKKYKLSQTTEAPEFDFDYHPLARQKFIQLFGEDPALMPNPELNIEWHQVRLNAISSLVREIKLITDSADLKLSAAVFPYPELARKNVRQDWSSWPANQFYPMLYHNFYDKGLHWINFAIDQIPQDLQQKTIAGLFIPALSDSIHLDEAIRQSLRTPVGGISFFSVDHLPIEMDHTLKQIIKKNIRPE